MTEPSVCGLCEAPTGPGESLCGDCAANLQRALDEEGGDDE